MFTIFKHEMKTYRKSLLIWSLCVGGMGMACILLFSSMQDSMAGMAEEFASMGGFSEAFGINQLNIGTLPGFYAMEVGNIHTLGGAMFAAIISTNMLSKEEDGHTGEFLFTLSLQRGKVVLAKWAAVFVHIVLMNLFCVAFYSVGIVILGEEMPLREFFLYHAMQLLMQLEIAGICFAFSAFQRKNKLGLGLGVVLVLYAYDLIARVIPDLSDYKFVSPFSYANAPDLFCTGEVSAGAAVLGAGLLIAGVCTAYIVYVRKDLAS
ncbi:MAG: ABC transporter permease subunit [Lachnospiraceae bacterium]|nr:ABC transporter permease subunit [Lachnospiraceae bacterium]